MLKIVGCSLILIASGGIAYCIQKEMNHHMVLLYELRRLFLDISYEMQYAMMPMEYIFLQKIQCKEPVLEKICREIGTLLEEKQEKDGGSIWSIVFEKPGKELALKGEEFEVLKAAGNIFFGKSMEENKNSLSLFLERWNDLIAVWQKERRDKQKVYQTVTVMCGLMIMILLI